MPWLRIDDEIVDGPKTLVIWDGDPAAFGLDIRGMAYCAKHLTDGVLPKLAVEQWVPDQAERERLVGILYEARRWELVQGGYEIHDYLDYNPSRAEVLTEREQKAAAGRKGGKASGRSRRRQG